MSSVIVPNINLLDYQPPMSLWQMVEDHVHHTHEQQEIKRILGESLVDQSLELHEEVKTLMLIWQEVKEKVTSANTHMVLGLPEPPQQRERLVQEICFFARNVRDKAKKQGVDPEKYLAKHNNMSVIDYAIETNRPHSSRASRTSPMSARVVSPNERHSSNIFEEVRSVEMSRKFNYLHVDDVLQNLRHQLEEEIKVLLRDITYLQGCLDEEISLQSPNGWEGKEPTLSELKEERAVLEKELLMPETTIPVPPPKNKPSFDPEMVLRMHLATTPAGERNHQISTGGSRPQPMKAIHAINGTMMQGTKCPSLSQVSLKDATVLDKPFQQRSVSPSQVKFVSVGSILSPDGADSSQKHATFLPSPPTPTKPVKKRPSSADRFRKLVLECRDGK